MTEPSKVSKIFNHIRTTAQQGIDSPNVFGRLINQAYHRRLASREYNTDGVDVIREDWDNLVILDACRLDTFKKYNTVDGELETRVSRGSNTVEFLRGNISDRDLLDTVYVTANPQLYNHQDMLNAEFHHVRNLWKEWWDEENNTVMPETVTQHALEAAEQFPNKRLIIHYIQPHMPFINSSIEFDDQIFDTSEDPWNWIMQGMVDVSKEEMRQANDSNLDVAMPHVENLVEGLQGKAVVTSDHGQCICDRSFPIPIKEWGHPWGTYVSPLVRVPWLICDDDQRKEITREDPTTVTGGVDDDIVEERLQALGYAE